MPRPAVTRLREQQDAAPLGGPVIDASFRVVRRNSFWRRMRKRFYAVLLAAAIGLAIPPLWVLVQHLREGMGG